MNQQLKQAIGNELILKAPKGFSDKVMNTVFEMNVQPVIKPLISKRGWLIISLCFIAVFVFLFKMPVSEARDSSSYVDFSWVGKILSQIPEWNFQFPGETNVGNMLVILAVCVALLFLISFDSFLLRRDKRLGD